MTRAECTYLVVLIDGASTKDGLWFTLIVYDGGETVEEDGEDGGGNGGTTSAMSQPAKRSRLKGSNSISGPHFEPRPRHARLLRPPSFELLRTSFR